ncbi:MAG: Type 1 glutamine amidotransferase-like domain-containing protein [Desulfobacteraceae bacterium]
MGYLVLQGGSEFGGRMRASDLRAIALAGGRDAAVAIVPAAAAPDGNHRRAGKNGLKWFHMLGARNVTVLPLVDRQSADDPDVASGLRRSRLIYLLGGFPEYLAGVLQGSTGWKAIRAALAEGAVLAGSSVGRSWVDRLQKELPSANLIGIDEETGMINDGPAGTWSVYGAGAVVIHRGHKSERYGAGQRLDLERPQQ